MWRYRRGDAPRQVHNDQKPPRSGSVLRTGTKRRSRPLYRTKAPAPVNVPPMFGTAVRRRALQAPVTGERAVDVSIPR